MTEEREPLHRTPEEVADDDKFFRRYGPWEAMDPPALADFMAGFTRPWWIVGGWSIEAFTGVRREHEDVDLTLLACDLDAFRAHVGDAWHLWSNHGGTLRPFDDRCPEVLDVSRPPKSHLGFGHGAHACVGPQLARIELTTVLGVSPDVQGIRFDASSRIHLYDAWKAAS